MVLKAEASPRGRRPAPVSKGVAAAKAFVHLACLAPAAILAMQVQQELATGSGGLGADPVAAVEHRLGLWALRILLATLAITPLRQLTGKPVLLRFRRLLGLYAFFYATLHFTAYLVLDLRGYWAQVLEDIAKRPYITVGFVAWLLLVPLAVTSTQAAMRRLGRNWGRLHKAIYAVGVLAVLHFWWLVKSDIREPALYAVVLAVLLGWRVARRLRDFSARRKAATG